MKFEKKFKEAVLNLPAKEKDKLLMRLLKKDMMLANRLHFELVSTDTVDDRRRVMEEQIISNVQLMTERYFNPATLLQGMRRISGEIKVHVTITKDKFGDVSLNLLLLNEILKHDHSKINEATSNKTYKFSIYIISKVFKALIQINDLHEDFRMEFKDLLHDIGNGLSRSNYLMDKSVKNGLDINWLLLDDIPEDIAEIHKNIKALGFLK